LGDGQGAVQDRACGIELAQVAKAAAGNAEQADSTVRDGAQALGMSSGLQHMRQQRPRAAIRRMDLRRHR
jgi:hypothetical protein